MIKFFQKLKARKGFTLVELIVVIAIIGVLAAILIPTMLGYVTSSRVTSADSTASSLKDTINALITEMDSNNGKGLRRDDGSISFGVNATGACTPDLSAAPLTTAAGGNAAGGAFYDALKKKIEDDYTFVNVDCYALIDNGTCVGVLFCNGDTIAAGLKTAFTETNIKAGTLPWGTTTTTAGIDDNGVIVGSSPKLQLP